jgi:two-component system, NtrC family, response regulator AtoC
MESANILIIDDNEDLALGIAKALQKEGFKAVSTKTGEEGLLMLRKELVDLVLLDLKLPKMNGIEVLSKAKEMDPDLAVIMMTASTDVKPAIEAMKTGALDYLMKPFEMDEMKLVVRKALEMHQLKIEVARLRREHAKHNPIDTLYGDSPKIKDVRRLIQIVAETPRTSVLIQGESGTGKELVSNAVHFTGSRSAKPYIKINCSAIPDNLLESELFGHEKGAFTDAKMMKKGLFELANGGTIFLDEISSMKLSLQPKLLRVLETQTFRRIGGIADIRIDVRVIAASNSDLGQLVKNKEFRDDLYYRLKVMEIDLPPLRDRREDVMLLAKLFLQEFNKEFNKHVQKFNSKTEELLQRYAWPGNVRELKNVIERSVILTQGDSILPEHLPLELRDISKTAQADRPQAKNQSLEEMEKHHITEVLNSVKGNKSQAAKVLNISRSTLREKLKAYGIT